jgi:hypothetical protein
MNISSQFSEKRIVEVVTMSRECYCEASIA